MADVNDTYLSNKRIKVHDTSSAINLDYHLDIFNKSSTTHDKFTSFSNQHAPSGVELASETAPSIPRAPAVQIENPTNAALPPSCCSHLLELQKSQKGNILLKKK